MKKTILFVLCLALACSLAACGKRASIGIIGGADGPTAIFVSGLDGEQTEKLLEATVTKIENGSMFVTPIEGSSELASADCFCVPLEHVEVSPEPVVGDLVAILYNGDILESYPAGLGEIFHIEVLRTPSS